MGLFGRKDSGAKAEDPFYNRKPIPDDFVQDVGDTGLTPQEEYATRERKYSGIDGVDIRKFSNSKKGGFKPQHDPYYGRKPVNKAEIAGVGETGLNAEEEFANRERKYSVGGVDVRRFGSSASSGFKPTNDPYYGRKRVDKSQTVGVGELENAITPAEAYATRERKQSAVNFSSDPFELLVGSRESHRQSISSPAAVGVASAATERRRSSAVGPHAMQHAAQANAHHSGYGGDTLAPIESRPEIPPSRGVDGTGSLGTDDISSAAPSSNMPSSSGPSAANGDHTVFHDVVTHEGATSAHETHHATGKGVQKQDYDFVDEDSVDPLATS